MKKYFKFSLIAVLLLAIAGNVAAENVTLRFKAPDNMTNISVYLYGRTASDNEDKTVKDGWPGTSVNIVNGYFSVEYNNASYEWINAIVSKGGSSQQDLQNNPTSASEGKANVINGGYWIIANAENLYPIWPVPQAKNGGENNALQQPAEVYLGDKDLLFGCHAWAKAFDSTGSRWKLWISQTKVLYEGYPRSTTEDSNIGWSGWNTENETYKSATSAQFTDTGTWYWGIEVDYGSVGSTYYATNSTDWTYMIADNELATKANLTVEVLPVNNPQISVNSSTLSWTKNAQNHNVMVVKTTDLAWEPVQGTAYTTSSTIDNGAIIQNDGTGLSTTIESGYIYKVYSVNNNYYSSSVIHIPDGQRITLSDNVKIANDLYLSNTIELVGDNKTLTANKIYAKITVPNSTQWHFIGVPFDVKSITGTTGTELKMGTGASDDYAIAYYNGAGRAEDGQSGWRNWASSEGSFLLPAGGYIFWVNKTKVADCTLILESNANPITVSNSKTIEVNYYTDKESGIHNGWNLVVNPLFSTAGATLESGQFHYAYDYTNDTYTVSDENISSVKPFDSYFVKTASNNSVSFTSTATQSPAPQSAPGRGEKVTVYLENGETAYSTKIRLNTDATVEYNELYDAPHMMSMSAETPQIYTLIRSDKMAINSIPEEASLTLGVRVPQGGEYTIRWDSQVFEKTVLLHDQASDEIIDMLENASYTFTTATGGEINDRFSISFTPAAVTNPTKIDNGINGQIRILSRQNAIVLEGLNGSSAIQLYDLLGRHIHGGFTQGGTYQIPVPNKGIYIVEIKNENSTVKTKIIYQ